MNVDSFLCPCSSRKHPAEVLFYNFVSYTSRKKKKKGCVELDFHLLNRSDVKSSQGFSDFCRIC